MSGLPLSWCQEPILYLGLGYKNCSHQLFCRLDKLVSKCVHHGDPIIFSKKFPHFSSMIENFPYLLKIQELIPLLTS